MTKFNVGGLELDQPFRIRRIGHIGYHAPDVNKTADFLRNLVGLQHSDVDDFSTRVPQLSKEEAKGYFLRCGSDHHSVVIGAQALVDTREPHRKGALVGQVSWQVGSLQEVVDGIRFMDEKTHLRRVGRDSPGSNWHAYVYDPDGYINEIYYGMEQIGWDGRSKPSSMYDRAFHEKPELPQISEKTEVGVALEREGSLLGFRDEQDIASPFDVEGILMERPFKVTRLGRITLFVQDLEKSLEFYTQVMGLTVTAKKMVMGHECAFLRADREHHTLALLPKALMDQFSFGAAYSLYVATYAQFKNAYEYFKKHDVRILDLPAEISPGVSYSFWVQGPDNVAIQFYHGMDAVDHRGNEISPMSSPVVAEQWPEAITPQGHWYDPVFLGPLA